LKCAVLGSRSLSKGNEINISQPASNLSEEAVIKQVLHWIGFRSESNKNAIVDDGLQSFNDVKMMSEEDIKAMATSFANRTAVNW